VPVQEGASPPPLPFEEANTENFLASRAEPQCGHCVPFQSADRTNTSLSFPHFSH
jgi:hypothetical protein